MKRATFPAFGTLSKTQYKALIAWGMGLNKKPMKTYTKQIEKPRLVIAHDEYSASPRRDGGNVGYFFTKESRHISPDGTTHALYQIMVETGDEAKDLKQHIALIKARAAAAFKESAPKDGNSHDEELHVIEIHPVYRYEHGNVVYKRGIGKGFDYSNCGFYIVTAQSISGRTMTAESIAKAIDAELAQYTQWANGEVYRFTVYDKDGEEEDSCGGYYALEDMREALGDEWKNEKLEDYIKN